MFPTFADNLEQYNPEAFPIKLQYRKKTYDKDGNYHSYNDMPMFVSSNRDNPLFYRLAWYSHGKKYREGNKPVSITLENGTYATYDENDKLHSYDGMPSSIEHDEILNYLDLQWHNHGMLHRDNDKPASISGSPKDYMEVYYQNDMVHRENFLPAIVKGEEKTWFIQDILHNVEGFAALSPKSLYYPQGITDHGLYGVVLPEETFQTVKVFAETTNAPLWLSFFVTLGIVEVEQVNSLTNSDTGKFESVFPINWLLHFWNITNETFTEKVNKLDNIYFYETHKPDFNLLSLLKVVEHEDKSSLTILENESCYNA